MLVHGISMDGRTVLHSWKEIANYTGRGIRTIQRYEANFGFPIHRPAGRERSAVLAFSDEVDGWLSKSPTRGVVAEILQRKLTNEQVMIRRRPYVTMAANAKRSRETAEAIYQSCMRQATQLQVLIEKLEETQKARRKLSAKSAKHEIPPRAESTRK